MSSTNTIPATGSHAITLAYAIQLTSAFRNNRELVLANNYKAQDILPFSETFNKADVISLLAQTGAAALRCYYGMDEENKLHVVLVATNSSNEDILPSQSFTQSEEEDLILQEGQRCPVICPPASPLNN